MKKFLAVVLSAALVAGLAAGCGSKEDGKEEDKGSSAKTAKVIDVDLTNEEYAFGIDKDQPELVEQVNAFIKEVKKHNDSQYDSVVTKHFKIMFSDILHEELDRKDGNRKRNDRSQQKQKYLHTREI